MLGWLAILSTRDKMLELWMRSLPSRPVERLTIFIFPDERIGGIPFRTDYVILRILFYSNVASASSSTLTDINRAPISLWPTFNQMIILLYADASTSFIIHFQKTTPDLCCQLLCSHMSHTMFTLTKLLSR